MAQNVAYGSQFNPTQVYVDGVYIEVVPPTGYFGGIPTSVAADWGTGSWGPLNSPMLNSTPNAVQQDIGPIGPVALTDIYDLATDAKRALNQASNALGMFLYSTRVHHGFSDITITGTITTGDVVNLYFWSPTFIGINGSLSYNLQYTTLSGDTTPTLLATSLVSAIAANSILTEAGFTAVANGAAFSVAWPMTPTGIGSLTPATNGASLATVGGTTTPTDVITLKFFNQSFAGGEHDLVYTVQAGDTTTSLLATSLLTAINADTAISGAGIAATRSAAILTFKSLSPFATTYGASLSAGATETVVVTGGATETLNTVGAPACQASSQIFDTSSPPQLIGTILGVDSGTLGEQISYRFTAGTVANTITVTVIPFAGAGPVETYPNLPGTGAAFGNALAAALNGGANTSRGPSNYLRLVLPQTSTLPPALNTLMNPQTFLTGGNDGRLGITSADLVGSSSGEYPTGIYTISTAQFTPSVAWIAGLTDTSVWSTIMAFAQANNIFFLNAFPQNTSVVSAVAQKQSLAIADFSMGILKDWVYWFDQANNITRILPPTAIAGGLIATLPPWASPLNVPMTDIVGTERNNPTTGNFPYQQSDLASLEMAGIMVITNPIPGYQSFGLRNSQNSLGNKQPNSVVEYSRMTFYLVESNNQLLGPFIGKLQGSGANDPLRAAVRNALNNFYGQLSTNGYIVGANVICNTSNNTQQTVSQFALYVYQAVTYMASVLDILATIQGGVTVNYLTNPLGVSTMPVAA